jgi:Predicted esterase of the alpha-beta hydrolase superfamily
MSRLAIVLSAGGARGAYEAGVIYYLRTGLPKKLAHRIFPIKTGTSVGAINTVLMASMADNPKLQGEKIKELWLSIRQEDIYRRDFGATAHFIGSTFGGLIRNFTTFNPLKFGNRKGPHFSSFLDTTPLRAYLKKHIPWDNIGKNILNGPVDAVAINATNLQTGQNEVFLQRKPDLDYMGHYRIVEAPIGLEHAMASSAIPIIFPSVRIGDYYYSDGGLRLFTPMSPAIQLGAERLLIIGLRHSPSPGEKKEAKIPKMQEPTIADQMGRLLNGLFLDRIQYDLEQLKRINTVIDISEKVYGRDYVERVNQRMRKEGLRGDIASRGLKKIRAVEVHPSEFISDIFARWYKRLRKGKSHFSAFEKMMVRLLDIDPTHGQDLLSYLTFAPDYLHEVFELGYQDAQTQRGKIIEIMEE